MTVKEPTVKKRGRPADQKKHHCYGCTSTNLRFNVGGDAYHCWACGRKGSKKEDVAKAGTT